MTDHSPPPALERHFDVAVIGGSAAGLAAALQLSRQRRSVVVVDDDTPRNAPAEHMHGYLGREGVRPSELAAIGRDEVRAHGGEVLAGRVLNVRREGDGSFRCELSGGHTLVARRVLSATGLVDVLPDIDGLAERWGREVIHCPFCHGFEVRDQRLVLIVTHPMGLHPIALLRHLTNRLTIVLHDAADIDESAVANAANAGVTILRDTVRRLVDAAEDGLVRVELVEGSTLEAEAVLVGPRFHGRGEVLDATGVKTSPHPSGLGDSVMVDQTGQTTVPGLYAAGNLTDPSMQVLHAAAHGSRVGAMIAFDLADDDLATGQRRSGELVDWDHRYDGAERMWSSNPNGTFITEASDLTPRRALDVGAGEGADALWLAEQGWEVTASDISGNALARLGAEADRRGLVVRCLRADANEPTAFGTNTYDLVSLQYGSIPRTPDQRGIRNLLAAVAPGGTLLVVAHDLSPMRKPVDVAAQTRMFDPDAYVGTNEIVAALRDAPHWSIEVHATRLRPPGAASTHHINDVVLRAKKAD